MLGVQNEREWQAFCTTVLGEPALATDERFNANSRRVANRDALHAIIVGRFERLGATQLVTLLEDAQIANARVNGMAEVWEHPQLKARKRWTTVATPAGSVPALLPPGMTDARMEAVPALGEHSERVLAELGYDATRIERLRADGVI